MTVYGTTGHVLELPEGPQEAVKVLEARAVGKDYRNGSTHWWRIPSGRWLCWTRPMVTCIRCRNENWVLIAHSCGKEAS